VGSAPSAALFFGTYTLAKGELEQRCPNIPGPVVHMTAATAGEIVKSVVRVPTEIVKQRMQAGRYPSLRIAVVDLFRTCGTGGLFRSYASTLARDIPFALIQYPLYEALKLEFARAFRQEPSAVESAVAGSVAGVIAAVATTPLDVAKTRIMLGNDPRMDVVTMLHAIYREEGVRRLFSGVLARVSWIAVAGFVFFGTFEYAKDAVSESLYKAEYDTKSATRASQPAVARAPLTNLFADQASFGRCATIGRRNSGTSSSPSSELIKPAV
jgi:solute carrier family 25 S-adenosylmethionine transporter 26